MSKKLKVAVIFGGRSAEHKVSLRSAKNIVAAIDNEKYEPVLIGIDNKGQWLYHGAAMKLLFRDDPSKIEMEGGLETILLSQNADEHTVVSTSGEGNLSKIDVIFPILHGTYGEDGAIQGFAKLANLPCVGPGILGSSMGMDKEIMKRLLRDAGIGIAKFETLRNRNKNKFSYQEITDKLGAPVFIKPANMGSSIGISQVKTEAEFQSAIDLAFRFDNKVIIEEKIIGREIECAVLGNDNPIVSIPGEVIPKEGFYSYERKYLDENGAELAIPAELTNAQTKNVQQLSLKIYECLECYGMARVDVFLKSDDTIVVNEINTLPGFTSISMYPTLWKASGISNRKLIDRLIQLAVEKHSEENRLEVTM